MSSIFINLKFKFSVFAMAKKIIYTNPSLDVTKRSLISPGTPRYEEIINAVISEFNKKTNMYYCATCHSIETRSSIPSHQNPKPKQHQIFTKGDVIGNEMVYYV